MLRGHYRGFVLTITDGYRVALSSLEHGAVVRQLTPETTLAELVRHLDELVEILVRHLATQVEILKGGK